VNSDDGRTGGLNQQGEGSRPDEATWAFRGYHMRPSEFNTAMVHFYRGEIQRANTWRTRLDTTTNWAIITAGTAITFSLSDAAHHHGVILLTMVLTCIFLFIEARRYRYFELWSYRIRLLETDFFAAMLVPPFQPSPDWAETLANSLLQPKFPISIWEALGRRLRRNYFAIFSALILVWLFKNYTQPTEVTDWAEFIQHARVGPFGGELVLALVAAFSVGMVVFATLSAVLQDASGEVLTHHKVFEHLQRRDKPSPRPTDNGQSKPADRPHVWQRPSARREQYLTLIISDKGVAIAARLMQDLQRGVTALHGEGMYTHAAREVLLCALTETEIESLKRVVGSVDPAAFVVVMPASEIEGRGFIPLQE
jgi:uncharacterized membrane protein